MEYKILFNWRQNEDNKVLDNNKYEIKIIWFLLFLNRKIWKIW
jgi:hypothetical protein